MEEKIYLKKPKPLSKEKTAELIFDYLIKEKNATVEAFFNKTSNEKYLYWDKTKYLTPIDGLTADESWFVIKQIRQVSSIEILIKSNSGKFFTWYRPLYTDKFLREIDMHAGGLFLTEKTSSLQEKDRQKYLARGIVEESIASSQLEGADTSRRYAKKMLTEHLRPRTKSEQMIVNNYLVLQKIENDYKNEPLSTYLLQTLQSQLTEKTLDETFRPGEFRKDEDDIIVGYDNKIAHVPPKAAFVKKELERLINYANNDSDFIHPVIKAIQLHFWIGYLHPFPDGNGRLARAIFYWYLFKHGYWAMGYLPISAMLKKSQHDYTYAYIYSEQDDNDFTYFYDYNMKKILKSIELFKEFIEKRSQENKLLNEKIKNLIPTLNSRQIHTLKYLASHSDAFTSGTSYKIMHGVALKTAYRDLKTLNKLGYVYSGQDGKNVLYRPTEKTLTLFQTS